jgi:hypothetical protein
MLTKTSAHAICGPGAMTRRGDPQCKVWLGRLNPIPSRRKSSVTTPHSYGADMKHDQKTMILAHQRGRECARERGTRQDMLAHCAVFPTVEERDAFLAGYYAETRRITMRT